MTIAPQRYRGKPPGIEDGQEGGRAPVERFYELLGARASERKLAQDVALAESLLAEGFRPEDLIFAVEWAIAHIPKVKSFGLIPYVMHQALKARDDVQHAQEAQQEAEARVDEQLRREREERERRQRLADMRASLSEETRAALKHRAEEALAPDGVPRTHVGYDLLVKLKLDELLLETRYEGDHSASEAATPEAKITPPASNGQEALNLRAGESLRAGQEATRHGWVR